MTMKDFTSEKIGRNRIMQPKCEDFFKKSLPGKLIKRKGAIGWPARSPDLPLLGTETLLMQETRRQC